MVKKAVFPKMIMMKAKVIEKWIERLPDSSEKDYYSNLFDIIREFKIDQENVDLGISLLFFLQRCDFESDNLNTVTHPASGSLLADSLFVSKLFYKVDLSSVKWKTMFLMVADDSKYLSLIEWWKLQIKSSKKVIKLLC